MAMNPRLLRPRASGFNPLSIGQLAGWWDAATATSVSLNSGEVSQWNDLSGNGRHASQSVANNQPTYSTSARNGRNAIQFNGSTDFLRGSWPVTLTQQSVFAAVSMSSTNSWGRPFTQGITQDGTATGAIVTADFAMTGHYIPLIRNSTSAAFGSYNAGSIRASTSVSYDTWGVWSSIHTGSQIQNRLDNGTASTYSTTAYNTTFHTFCIGAILGPSVNQFFAGLIGEVIVYSRAVTDAERNRIAAYLKAKWATP